MDNPVFEDGNSINPVHVRSNESGGMACTPMGNHHRKSNSLDAGMGKQMKQQPTRETRASIQISLYCAIST